MEGHCRLVLPVLVVLVLLVVEAMLGGSVELSVREVAPGNLVDIL